jgi:hypothetical protein
MVGIWGGEIHIAIHFDIEEIRSVFYWSCEKVIWGWTAKYWNESVYRQNIPG